MKRGKKQCIWRKIGIVTMTISLAAGSLWYFCVIFSDHKAMFPDQTDMEGTAYPNGSGMITAIGVTETGIDTVTFAIDFLEDTSLCVEGVYLSDGDTVTSGEAYIKFTDDSMEKARAELEKAVQDTKLAFRSKVISNGEDKIQAKYTYDMALLEAKFAPQVYQDTLTQLEMELVKAAKSYEEAQEEYDAYYLAVENNTFYEDYRIEKLKKAYDEAYDLFDRRRTYWQVTQEELDSLSKNTNNENVSFEQADRQWIVRTVALLKDKMTETHEEYEQAKRDYRREIAGAELKLQKLLNQLERAQQSLIDAQIGHEKGALHAKTLYELAAARGQVAENDYNACLMSLEDELESLRDAKDKAAENQMFFEELVGDGYLYTEQAGTIFKVDIQKGQALAGGEPILAYSDPKERFVPVILPESNAADLFVGKEVSVEVADSGSFDGMVEAIQPIAVPDGKTPVCDSVIVSISGDSCMIEPGQTAVVEFEEEGQDEIVQCSADKSNASRRGIVSPMYDLGTLTETDQEYANDLKIAEVYVEAGQYIREGEPVCQFTQDSIKSVRKELAYIRSDAQIALMKAQTSYHIGVLEAGLFHNEATVGRTLAQAEYDNTVAKLNSNMVAKILETEQLLGEIYQLQTDLTDNAHQRQRADAARAYDQAKKQVENARECFVTSQVEAATTLQAVKDSYEDFFDQLEMSNQQIADKVEEVHTLQEEILQIRQLMEKGLLTAEQTRISALTEGEIADIKYAGILKEYENAVQKAQADLEQATQKLDDFNRFVGDGTLYAAGDGLVAKTGYKKGDSLKDMRQLVLFVADTGSSMEENGEEDTQ